MIIMGIMIRMIILIIMIIMIIVIIIIMIILIIMIMIDNDENAIRIWVVMLDHDSQWLIPLSNVG